MTKKQQKFVQKLRDKGVAWPDVAKAYNKEFKKAVSHDGLRHQLRRATQETSATPAQPKTQDTARDHLGIPDTQVKEGVPLDHWNKLPEYIAVHKPPVIVHYGDHWDMPSLSSYETRGGKKAEGRRIQKDIDAGNRAMDTFMEAIAKIPNYSPELHFLIGNHEQRIERAVDSDARLEGLVGYHRLHLDGWQVHDFLKPITIDGVAYAHYFYNHMSGKPIGGTVENRLKRIGHSFTQGHSQELLFGRRDLSNGTCQYGLVAGAFYLHEEGYKGPQANSHWRGFIHKRRVLNGTYDLSVVSIERLLEGNYE